MKTDEIVFTKVMTIVDQSGSVWTGTMSNLRTALNRVSSRNQRDILPASPAALRLVVNRITNRLRNKGIGVRFSRSTDHKRTRLVRFVQ